LQLILCELRREVDITPHASLYNLKNHVKDGLFKKKKYMDRIKESRIRNGFYLLCFGTVLRKILFSLHAYVFGNKKYVTETN
jgi:hypothetical protein